MLQLFCQLAHCEAKLDIGLELSAMDTALFLAVRLVELEEPELDCPFREAGVQVKHMVATAVVMFVPAVIGVISFIPYVRKLSHCTGFCGVEVFQKFGVYRSAIALGSALCDFDCAADLLFVGGHDVCEVRGGS